jgi:hypothetical protein
VIPDSRPHLALREGLIRAYRPHCLFNKKLEQNEKLSKAFRVACFTEVPLNQLHLLTQEIPRRRIQFEPYGFCFAKDFLYVNSYGGNTWLYDCAQQLYKNSHTKCGSPPWPMFWSTACAGAVASRPRGEGNAPAANGFWSRWPVGENYWKTLRVARPLLRACRSLA